MRITFLSIMLSVLVFFSCGNNAAEKKAPVKTEPKKEMPAVKENKADVTLNLASNDQMQYDKKELKVKAGQTVKLVLTHTGKLAKEVMGHNWVLLNNGTDVKTFAEGAAKLKDNDYIPESEAIIAHTKTIGGGETTEVTFVAPAAGEYDYICTFPAHYAMMHGKFIVE